MTTVNLALQPPGLVALYEYWTDELSPFQLFFLTLVAVSTLTAVCLVTYIFVLMLIRNRRQRWADALQARIEDEIAIWLAGDYSTWELVITFREELKKDPRAGEVILSVIFATSKLFRREGQSALRELLTSLNLHRICYKLLRSRHWYQQAYATRIISQLQMVLALPVLRRKLKTQSTTLRLELITAMVALGDQTWLQDVEQTNTQLSDWEQILLLERFRRLDTDQLPPFDLWLSSKHPDWILFGIRLCRHYNRFDKILDMGTLLAHADRRVQMAVLDAFDYLGSPETIPVLMDYIQQATGEQLRCALKVLGNQGDPDVIDLLVAYTEHDDPAVRLSALSALKATGLSRSELQQLTPDTRYIDHLFDPKLS
ncbi:HEAT repeat domain-containing protein [Spirosoma taeanense]|uniref:HEAT repeat domain-containing protein n=1 Tax=Spirosoma taeanense TaxID=2735870 RepID=A0A6M5YAI6_9BACT|nr:HEAT repeat domain-containing protein [Spirosoma taeanense]QJW91207.1 HEAT repeat domain-containing protein [Spirosoma taeanense]